MLASPRTRARSRFTAALTLLLAAGLTGTPAMAAPDASVPVLSPSAYRSVTLITGDQVLLDAQGDAVGVTPGEGRSGIPLQIGRTGEHTYVVPADAEPLIDAGTLDLALFDVAELSRPEYGEVAGGGAPVLVRYATEDPAARGRLDAGTDAEVRELASVDGEAVVVAPEETPAAWSALTDTEDGRSELAPGVASLRLDRVVTAALDTSVPQIGAPGLWEAGLDGTGVRIAVLDTGIDTTHPDLAGQVVAGQNFSSDADLRDGNGHGTHVAATAAGTGAGSEGRFKGVAPGAELLDGKVLNTAGSGLTSGIVAGMEWAVAQGADVVNLSLGATDTPGTDPLEEAVEALSDRALFVVAAGNAGSGAGTLASPGVAEAALTVGAVDKLDQLADFSSRGPRMDGGVKPDVTAPGVAITAASAEGTRPDAPHPAPGYVTLNGTSMATPHVAGAAALLMQRHPEWSGAQVKALLTGSALPGDGTAYEQGTGRIDLTRATTQSVVAEPGSLNFGRAEWPHTDDEPQTRTVSYRNLGDTSVTLELTAATTGPDGGPAPEGLFTLGADRVTVPAGGTAGVEVTADTRVGGEADGAYSLTLTAAGDGQSVRSAGGLDRAGNTYEVTIEATGRDGLPPGIFSWAAWLTGLGNGVFELVRGENGTATVEVPAGDYTLVGRHFAAGGIDNLVAPKVTVDRDMTIAFDARDARPVEVTLPDPGARGYATFMSTVVRSGGLEASSSIGLPASLTGARTGLIGDPPTPGEVTSYFVSHWTGGDGSEYHLAHTLPDSFYTGHVQHVAAADLAKLTLRQGSSVAGATGVNWTLLPGTGTSGVGYYSDLPNTRTVYLQGDYTWSARSEQRDTTNGSLQTQYEIPARAYRPGESRTETVNTGVFGPALGAGTGGGGLVRDGDTLSGSIAPFTDGAGHAGGSLYDLAATTTSLYRDGRLLATADGPLDSARFQLPPGKARYRLVTTAARPAAIASVTSEVTWQAEFTSAHTSSPTAVPASVVRYAPELALDSTAPAGARQLIPVTVAGSAAGRGLASLSVSVSYDDGGTWRPAAVRQGAVTVTNPAAGGSVSLRATVRDRQGNAFGQTILDAYRTT
ncbi:S8 family serine peptidase [Streptomyces sp. NPDC056716]|uniref:S8 family peptidase n=1 Tax=unclassified Streptomyces TaxID=2593676 RepID=UPI0036CE3EB3